MKINFIIFFFIFIIAGFLSYRISLSYFSDTAQSTDNILTASSEFPSPGVNHVVISEAQISGIGTGHSVDDFVEFYNPTSVPFNLNGHRLVKRLASSPNDDTMKSWTTDAFIPAHGFYLWANNGIANLIGADASTSASITNNNSIALRLGAENTGSIVDSLSWNPASQSLKEGTEAEDPDDGGSLERKAYSTSTASTMGSGGSDETKGNGFDSNDNSSDFITRTTSQPQNSTSPTEPP